MLRRLSVFVSEQRFLAFVALLAIVAIASGRVPLRRVPEVVDGTLLLLLFALLIAVELLRESGLLQNVVNSTVRRFRRVRPFVLALAGVSGLLSAVVTNDVALFVVIPFTVVAAEAAEFSLASAVVVEILAANLLGCLTPLGNPQNLYVYHASGWSPLHFVTVMLPFVAVSAAAIAVAVLLLEPDRPLVRRDAPAVPLDLARASAGAICLLLVILEILRLVPAWPAAAAAALAALLLLRDELSSVDLSIIPIFTAVFIVVEALRSFRVYDVLGELTTRPLHLYAAGVLLSQVVSNVPATLLLAPVAHDSWRVLLYAVSAGGCGTMIASLANLLGWRIYLREAGPDPRFLGHMLKVEFAFLAITAGAGAVLLMFF